MLKPRSGARRLPISWLALTGSAAAALIPAAALAQPAATAQDPVVHGRAGVEEIVVTASPIGRSRYDVLQGTSVLSGEALDRALSASIGETLDRLPGVSQTGFGQGASRPVIRGLGGDRIRVLVGGIGSIDASTTSPDHAPAVDLATARRVEVVRGPATLLYGNNAVGGVVNVLDGRIPVEQPEGGADGLVRLGYGSNADERLAAGALDVGLSPNIVAHVDAYWRKTDDFEAPGFVRSAALRALEEEEHEHEEGEEHEHEEEPRGRVENSNLEQKGATGGLSVLGDWGFFGASVSRNETNYGIPAGHEHAEEEDDHEEGEEHEHEHEHAPVRIDLEQTRFDVMGEINRSFLAFETVRLRFGYADYEHAELEGDEVGTRFLNEGWEGRMELVQTPVAAFGGTQSGVVGLQMSDRDFEAIGEEAFVPPSTTFQAGAFLLQRLDIGALALEAGARFERQTVEAAAIGFDRDFTGISLSAGAGYTLPGGWLVGLSLSRTERAPNAEELLSNGPHLATGTFELGDPTLGEETALGAEATLKYASGPSFGALNLFVTNYDDFIYGRFTGAEAEELPVSQYIAADARFWGFEIEAGTEQAMGPGALVLEASAEYVRATDRANNDPIPRIPPLSARASVGYELPDLAGRLELVWADDQNRAGPLELATEGYTVLNASVDWHPVADRDLTLLFEVRNITDEEVRLATSYLRHELPQPGRDYRIALRAGF